MFREDAATRAKWTNNKTLFLKMYKREDPLEADNTKNTKSILNWWHKVPDDYFIEKDEFLIYVTFRLRICSQIRFNL